MTLNFTWWGNDDRAARYNDALALFKEKYPYITVQTSFAAFPDYWTARSTEAAGRALPDVMQFDLSYLREFNQNGQLLDLQEWVDNGTIDLSGFDDTLTKAGVLEDKMIGIPHVDQHLRHVHQPERDLADRRDLPGRGRVHLGRLQRLPRGRLGRRSEDAGRLRAVRRGRLHGHVLVLHPVAPAEGHHALRGRRHVRLRRGRRGRVPRPHGRPARRQGRLPRRPQRLPGTQGRLHGQRDRVGDELGQLPGGYTADSGTANLAMAQIPSIKPGEKACSSSRPCSCPRAPTPSTPSRPRR